MHEYLQDKHILIVDDNAAIGLMICEYGKQFAINTTHISDPRLVLDKLENQNFDLIVLDISMPHIDGFELYEIIKADYQIPIIFLTAKGQEQDRVHGLLLGADDYVVKPFSVIELFVRIETILKRVMRSEINSNGLKINIETRLINYNGKVIKLTPKAFDIFFYLVKKQGTVCKRDDLMENVMGTKYYLDDRVIDAHIKEIRQKIDSDIVKTKRGVGYIYE